MQDSSPPCPSTRHQLLIQLACTFEAANSFNPRSFPEAINQKLLETVSSIIENIAPGSEPYCSMSVSTQLDGAQRLSDKPALYLIT